MPILTNRAAVLTSVLLLLSANTVLVVKAAEPLYSMYYQEGSKLFKEKRLQEALDKFKEAEKNSEHLKPDSLDKAKLDEFIGQIYCRLSQKDPGHQKKCAKDRRLGDLWHDDDAWHCLSQCQSF